MSDQENRDQERAIVASRPRPQAQPLALYTLEDKWRFATCVAKAGLAPRGLTKPEQVLLVIEAAAELGKGPMWGLQNLTCINNVIGVRGDAALGLVTASGLCKDYNEWFEGDGEDLTAHAKAVRADNGREIHRTFSVADAKRAGLWGKDTYQKYPQRMLMYRARGFCLRDGFPDVLQGMHISEELASQAPPPSIQATVVPPREERRDAPPKTPGQRLVELAKVLIESHGAEATDEVVDKVLQLAAKEAIGDGQWDDESQWTQAVAERVLKWVEENGLRAEWIEDAQAQEEAEVVDEDQGDQPPPEPPLGRVDPKTGLPIPAGPMDADVGQKDDDEPELPF